MALDPLNLPDFEPKLKAEAAHTWIYDSVRKKYVILTPEEWVRQHFVNYLVQHLEYPRSLLKVESGLAVNAMARRSDILVYNRQGEPHMLIECKAPTVKVDQKVFDQVSAYNLHYQAKLLVVTNGITHYCCAIDQAKKQYTFLSEIPAFN
jgi:hypothetical protein